MIAMNREAAQDNGTQAEPANLDPTRKAYETWGSNYTFQQFYQAMEQVRVLVGAPLADHQR